MSSNSRDQYPPDVRAKEAQLIIGLKFHYGKTLEEIPLEVAVDAMVKVWESCNRQTEKPESPGLMDSRPRRVSPPKASSTKASSPKASPKTSPPKASPPNVIHL